MPHREDSYLEGVRKCCCSNANKEARYTDDIGSSDSEDEIFNAQIEEIRRKLRSSVPSDEPLTWKKKLRHSYRGIKLTREDLYFFKHTSWQHMHLGTNEILKNLDFVLYRFIYAIVSLVLIVYFMNIVTNEQNTTGIIYLEAWCFILNTIYALIFVFHILRDRYRSYRTPIIVHGDPENPDHIQIFLDINPLQIRELKRKPVDRITFIYQLCWLLLNVFMSLHPAVSIVLLTHFWQKRDSTGISGSIFVIHLVHILGVILELLIARIPIRIVHFIYPFIFVHIYAVFTIVMAFVDGPVYKGMDWKRNFVWSYVQILLLCLIALVLHVCFHFIFRFREWLLYKIERNRQTLYCQKEAKHRRSHKRRAKLDVILTKCTSTEIFEYITKHVTLFREFLNELDERDLKKKEIDELRDNLLEFEDVEIVKTKEMEKAAKTAAQLQFRIRNNLKKFLSDEAAERQPKKFETLISDIMNAIKTKRKEAVSNAKRLKEEELAKRRETRFIKRTLPPLQATLSDYQNFWRGMRRKSKRILRKYDKENEKFTFDSYTKMMVPITESDPGTFSGLTKVLIKKRRDAKEAKRQRDNGSEEDTSDDYPELLARIRAASIRGNIYPLEYHMEKCKTIISPEYINTSNFMTYRDSVAQLMLAEATMQLPAKERAAILAKAPQTVPVHEDTEPEAQASSASAVAVYKQKKERKLKRKPKETFYSKYDKYNNPPPAPAGAKVVILAPVPKKWGPPDPNVMRIQRAKKVLAPVRKWYTVGTFTPRESTKKVAPLGLGGFTHSVLDIYRQDIDTRVFERITAKQQELADTLDEDMKKRTSGVMAGVRERLSPEFMKLLSEDWDLNVELYRFIKVHQKRRDERLYQGKPEISTSPAISQSATSISSTASLIPIIKESLTDQTKLDVLFKKRGEGILKQTVVDDGPHAGQAKKRRPSVIQFERTAVQTQVRTEAHGPMKNGKYHPLRPVPAANQALFMTTFHFLDDRLPHSGGLLQLDPKDLDTYRNHPGIHMHHPILHLDKPEGPHHNLGEALKDHTDNIERAKLDTSSDSAQKMERPKFGELRRRKWLIAFHPIVQYHSYIQKKKTKTKNKYLNQLKLEKEQKIQASKATNKPPVSN